MIKRIQNASLQLKILTFFLLMGLLLSLTFGMTFYKNTLDSAMTNKETELITLSDITASKIERFLFERIGDVQVLAQSQLFTDPSISKDIKNNYLNNVMHAYQAYDAIYVLDHTGTIDLSVGNTNYKILSDDIISSALIKDIYISDILENENGKRYIYFSAPLLSSDNKLLGAVVERMNFDAINEILESIQVGKSGYATLKSSEHDNIGVLNIIRLEGTEYYTTATAMIKYPSQTKQWYVNILQHRDEVLEIKYEIERYLSYVIIASLLLFIGLSYFISKKITQPIQNLMQKTSLLMQNNKLFASDITASNEVKTLASYFDTLLEELHFMMQQVLEKSGEAAYIQEIRASIETLFEHMPNGIITVSSSGQISSINAAATDILGVHESDLLNKDIKSEMPEHIAPLFEIIYQNLTEDRNLQNEVFRFQTLEDRPSLIFNTMRQLDLHHQLIGITVTINNLNAKKSFDESIFRAQQLADLGEMSAGVAHEIRNPLASIKGYAQVAMRTTAKDTQLYDDLNVILSEANRLEHILERFMNFARPNAPEFANCHLNNIIEETIEQISKGMQIGNINIRHRYSKKDLICVDATQIKQVMFNLILNAIQAMPNGGNIELVTHLNESSDIIEMHIVDDGEGIAKDLQEKIFSPFFTTRETGTGLGLAICSRIIENHHGILELQSDLNIGTKIIIKLPLEKGICS